MIQFEKEVDKILINSGFASDRLRKELITLCRQLYVQGIADRSYLDDNDDLTMMKIIEYVEKHNQTYGE